MGTNAPVALLTASVVEKQLSEYQASFSSIKDVGSSSITSTLSSTVTGPGGLSDHEVEQYKIGIACSVSFLSGAILLGMGLVKFGFISSYLSTSFLGGFTNAAAVHIITSQIPKGCNIKVFPYSGAGKVVKTYIGLFKNIEEINFADFIICWISIGILLIVAFVNEKYKSKLKVPIPIHLFLVILSTLISQYAELESRFGIAVVGKVATGFLTPAVPETSTMGRLAMDAFVIAIISYAFSIAMAKLMSKQHNYQIDDNQELVAYGLCNFIGSFFQCLPNCTGIIIIIIIFLIYDGYIDIHVFRQRV